MVGVSGVVAAPLLSGIIRRSLPNTHVGFESIWWPGEVPQALSDLLQHLLTIATVVARRERLGSHLSVSLRFLAPLHVKTYVKCQGSDEEASGWKSETVWISMFHLHTKEMSVHQ